jgi:hypothetical protein
MYNPMPGINYEKYIRIVEEYDSEHVCQTPDTVYSISVHSDKVTIGIEILRSNRQSHFQDTSEEIESDLHYAIEPIINKWYYSGEKFK